MQKQNPQRRLFDNMENSILQEKHNQMQQQDFENVKSEKMSSVAGKRLSNDIQNSPFNFIPQSQTLIQENDDDFINIIDNKIQNKLSCDDSCTNLKQVTPETKDQIQSTPQLNNRLSLQSQNIQKSVLFLDSQQNLTNQENNNLYKNSNKNKRNSQYYNQINQLSTSINNNNNNLNNKSNLYLNQLNLEKLEQEDFILQQIREKRRISKQKREQTLYLLWRDILMKTFFKKIKEQLSVYRFNSMFKKIHYDLLNDYQFKDKQNKKGIIQQNPTFNNLSIHNLVYTDNYFNDNRRNSSTNYLERQQTSRSCLKTLMNLWYLFQKGKFLQFMEKIPKLDPDSYIALILDVLSISSIILGTFFINIHWFFQQDIRQFESHKIILICFLVFYFLEALVRINIGIIKEAKLNTNHMVLLKYYKSNFLLQDFLGIVCVLLFLTLKIQSDSYIYTLEGIFLLKIRTLRLLKSNLDHKISMYGVESHFIQLVEMIWKICILSHFTGCIWHYLSIIQIDQGSSNTWLQMEGLEDAYWYERYIVSVFWANSLIMLIGTKGETKIEILFQTITLFFTVGIFAYILENISRLLKQINQLHDEYKKDQEIINHYMQIKNLDKNTQIKVRQHLEHCYKSIQELNINNQAQKVLMHLPIYLSNKIKDEINASIIKKFNILTQNFSYKTVKNLLEIMQETDYITEDVIFNQNSPESNDIYLILKGEIELFYYSNNKKDESKTKYVIQTLQSGSVLGLEHFFTGLSPQYSAKATKFTNICRIDRDKFINLLSSNQRDYEKFCVIKDQIFQIGISKYVKIDCHICQSKYHLIQDCKLLNYKPKRYRLFLHNQLSNNKQNDRVRYFRGRKNVEIPALGQMDTLKIINTHFRNKYPQNALNYDNLYLKEFDKALFSNMTRNHIFDNQFTYNNDNIIVEHGRRYKYSQDLREDSQLSHDLLHNNYQSEANQDSSSIYTDQQNFKFRPESVLNSESNDDQSDYSQLSESKDTINQNMQKKQGPYGSNRDLKVPINNQGIKTPSYKNKHASFNDFSDASSYQQNNKQFKIHEINKQSSQVSQNSQKKFLNKAASFLGGDLFQNQQSQLSKNGYTNYHKTNSQIDQFTLMVNENRTRQEIINKNELFLEFDMQKDFQIYFSKFNLSYLLRKYNSNQAKNQREVEKIKKMKLYEKQILEKQKNRKRKQSLATQMKVVINKESDEENSVNQENYQNQSKDFIQVNNNNSNQKQKNKKNFSSQRTIKSLGNSQKKIGSINDIQDIKI